MSEILRKWLHTRLGIIIDYNLTSFEEIAQDGVLLGQVLQSYGIISTSNLNRVVSTYDFETAYRNLVYLQRWLSRIGLQCNEKCMYSIAHKEKQVAIKLFYQLYVILNTKSKINYLINQNLEEGFKPKQDDTSVEKPYNACEVNEISVSPYINDTRNVLQWHRNRYMQLMKKCKTTRREYAKILEKKVNELKLQDERAMEDHNDIICGNLEKSKKFRKKIILSKPDINVTVDEHGFCVADEKKVSEYISYLQHKREKYLKDKLIQNQMHKMLMTELLNKLVDKEDAEFKEIILSKLLQQSCYEKQITTKLFEIRHQKEIMLEHMQNENKILNKQREDDFVNQLFQQHSNITFREKQYIENRKRQYELHKRLWKEKCDRESKEHHEICEKVIHDIVDLALKVSEYRKKFQIDMSEATWKECVSLFLIAQPIFSEVDDLTELVDFEDYYEPLTIELYRQNGLDKSDFDTYNNSHAVWELEIALQFYEENHEAIELGTNVLGYIVHRLLLLKYPFPKTPTQPILPPMDVRASLTGVENHEILPVLQKALTVKQVIILEMQTIINYCLEAYREECVVDVDTRLNEETEKGGKKSKDLTEKHKKIKSDRSLKKGAKHRQSVDKRGTQEIIEKVPKETQTPKIFPGEEIKFSKKAELGKYVYETLNLGLEINENLLTAMLIEYLKQLTHVKGWVLVNFPETLNEAYLLEEVLNGKPIPNKFIMRLNDLEGSYDLENRDDIFKPIPDLYITMRQSEILPNPKPPIPEKYVSFFTSFIHMQFKSSDLESYGYDMKMSMEKLISFYDNLNINNCLTYESVDYDTIKELVKLITRDEVFANEIYEELVNAAYSSSTSQKKKKDELKSKSKIEHEKKGKGMKGKIASKIEKSTVTIMESPKSQISKSQTSKLQASKFRVSRVIPEVLDIIIPARPGEENWEYVTLPLTLEFSRLLATTWQHIEDIYTNDFKELFFTKRIYQNQIIPYMHEISTNMQYFIDRPDKKQELVHEFQNIYNDIECDLRDDEEFKAELHCRISEFRNKLWNMCDLRMKECEEERRRIIKDNWFTSHSCTITNIYVKAAQLELDRCVQSLQLLQDYYSYMALKKPLENKFTAQTLPKFELNMDWGGSQIKRSGIQSDKTLETIANMLTDVKQTTENNPFVSFLHSGCQTAMSHISSWYNTSSYAIKSIESNFIQNPSKIPSKKKRSEVNLTENDIIINAKIEKLIQEWNCAVEGEILRTRFKLKLINEKATAELNDNLHYAEKLFHELHDRIQERYSDEVESVGNICQVFARAVEACEPVQVRLVLDGSKFQIDQNMLFYPDSAFIYSMVGEKFTDVEFSVAQLNMLTDIFLDLAPSGSMPERIFIYLLQDMIVLNVEECCESYLPQHWYHLKPFDVTRFVHELYGNSEYVDWKDFIIWNLLLPYPTEYELLDVRRQFREMDPDKLEYVNSQQFSCVHFWFEEEFSDEHEVVRMNLIKELLCKMFKINTDHINYSALLLYFCKDVESVRGISKALELSVGNLVCWDVEIGCKFIEALRYKQQVEKQRKQEVLSAVNSIVSDLFHKTMETCGSSTSFLDDFNAEEQSVVHSEIWKAESRSTLFEEDAMEEKLGSLSELPSLYYFLPFSVLLKIMIACFPWHSTVPYINDKTLREMLVIIYNSFRREEFGNRVFMHEFLNDEQFIDLINKNSKFLERLPTSIIRNYIEVCTCRNE